MISARPRPRHSWAEIGQPDALDKEELQIDAAIFRLAQTRDGQLFFAYLHEITTFKRNAPNAPEGALRELEANRRLVAILEARIERHLKGTKADGGRTRRGRTGAAAG